jgi:hypothetical protein
MIVDTQKQQIEVMVYSEAKLRSILNNFQNISTWEITNDVIQ